MSIHIVDLGKMNYREALVIQERLLARRQANEIGDTLLLVEHPATLTLGTRGQRANILASPEHLAQNGIEIFEVNRGGDVTYHGPGQIVGYPIMNLSCVENDIKRFIWNLEEVFIRLLSEEYGIAATREDQKYTGVWVKVPAGTGAAITAECGAAGEGTVTMGEGMSEKVNADMAGATATGDGS
ncbi:MAG: octanoyltransferase, partial [Clostridia bacterium]